MAPAVATHVGAEIASLPDRGHWWMVEDPDGAADALVRFWSRFD